MAHHPCLRKRERKEGANSKQGNQTIGHTEHTLIAEQAWVCGLDAVGADQVSNSGKKRNQDAW
jgi:hypothetical protein